MNRGSYRHQARQGESEPARRPLTNVRDTNLATMLTFTELLHLVFPWESGQRDHNNSTH